MDSAVARSSLISSHSFYRYHSLWVSQVSRQYGVPYWFVPHGILDPWVTKNRFIKKKLYWLLGGRKFIREASTVIFSTSAERDKAMSQFDILNADVIPWPVDSVEIGSRISSRKKICCKHGIPEEAKVLLFFGRLHSMKRPLDVIRSVAKAIDKNLHLLMVGNEQDVNLPECRDLAKALKIDDRVHLVGPVYGEEKFDYLLASDCYISMSERENFNHTAAESMAAGLPVILSPGNDLLSEIKDVDCYWRIEDNSIDSAAETIDQMMTTSDDRLKLMGANGRDWVERELNFERFRSRLLQCVEKYGRH